MPDKLLEDLITKFPILANAAHPQHRVNSVRKENISSLLKEYNFSSIWAISEVDLRRKLQTRNKYLLRQSKVTTNIFFFFSLTNLVNNYYLFPPFLFRKLNPNLTPPVPTMILIVQLSVSLAKSVWTLRRLPCTLCYYHHIPPCLLIIY